MAFYVAADVMLVTPYRDGMNLVAKEYVASRIDGDGALVLSEFTGAAEELDSAFLVNPYDAEGVKQAIRNAMHATRDRPRDPHAPDARAPRRVRRRPLGHVVPRRPRRGGGGVVSTQADVLDEALQRAAAVPRLLVAVDFDGTVSPIVDDPADAEPLPAAMDAIETLAGLAGTTVALVSGRALADLAARSALGPPVRLVGSHGVEIDDLAVELPIGGAQLLARLRTELTSIADGVAGVLVETKSASVAIHVRQADRRDAARVTQAALDGPGAWDGVHVLQGKEVVELAVIAPDKGAALHRLRVQTSADAVVYVGDDVTDEAAFAALTGDDIGVKVGAGTTLAAFRVDDPHDVTELIARLAAVRAWSLDAGASGATLPSWPSPISRPLT